MSGAVKCRPEIRKRKWKNCFRRNDYPTIRYHSFRTGYLNRSEQGKIVKFEGGREAAEYEKFLKGFNDDGMLKMAHMAYGFNPGAKLSGNVVEDERVWGCTEWGIGYVSEIEAPPIGQPAVSHTDGICLNSTIYFDGKKIMEEGKIV